MRFIIPIILIIFPTFSNSQNMTSVQFVESFSTRTRYGSGTAVWNQYLGKAHPGLVIVTYKPSLPPPIDIEVGTGADGVFDSTTYANFSVGGDVSGNIIRLNTDTYPILNVTNFILEAGWTLQPQGSKPLKIYSLNDVIVRGTIQCSGGDGGNAVNATPGTGGVSRCGGKNGGGGGSPSSNGTKGDDPQATVVTGGGGGVFTAGAGTGGGGGGGGSWSTLNAAASSGSNGASGTGGAGGIRSSDPEFTVIAGGGGGGGGSGNSNDAGAGGGAGGGVVIIHAVRNFELGTSPSSVTGYIYANGGVGGTSNVNGGAGGAGGGGSIQVFAGAAMEIYNTDGTGASRAFQGSTPAAGSQGRSWFSSRTYDLVGTGTYSPSEESPVDGSTGLVQYSSAAQEIISSAIDVGSDISSFKSLSFSPSSGDFQLQLNGSKDNFVSDSTGWTTTLSQLENKRYFKIRAVITTSNVSNPTMLDSVTVTYEVPQDVTDFQFVSAGCGRIQNPPKSKLWIYYLLSLLIPFLIYLKLRFKTKK